MKNRFQRIRHLNQLEIVEDYIEMISDLINEKGVARSIDLSKEFNVSQPTISKHLVRFKKEKYIEYEPYGTINLTEKGIKLASKCKNRHNIVYNFLLTIGVTKNIAELDSEGIEHHVSDETLDAMQKYINKNL